MEVFDKREKSAFRGGFFDLHVVKEIFSRICFY